MTGATIDAPPAQPAMPNARRVALVALFGLILAALFYETLIFAGKSSFFPPAPQGLVFNSMLLHLLDGHFDVDPQAVGIEAFVRGGKTYAYHGILPALLRLPLVAAPGFAKTDFTALSCLAAVVVMALFKLLSLITVWRSTGNGRPVELVIVFAFAILLGGAQTQFLKPSIFQEVELWADVFAAAFVLLVLRGYHAAEGFTDARLRRLALAAGLCLLTRVSTALGLYAAFGLLWLIVLWRRHRSGGLAVRELVRLLTPVLLLAGFVAVAGWINYERWGNPLVFVDLTRYQWAIEHAPDRLARVRQYGEFNPIRLGYGLIYYFFPVWVLRGGDGHLLWGAFQQRTIDAVELPPSSFFLSDPLLIGLSAYALVHLVKYRDVAKPSVVIAVLTGLGVPILLILTAIYMAFRYRIEFYPFLEFSAFIGFGLLLSRSAAPRMGWFRAAAYGGIVVSLALYFLYGKSPFGGPFSAAGTDLVTFYRTLWQL
jgi:hypothetical protein